MDGDLDTLAPLLTRGIKKGGRGLILDSKEF